MDQPQHLDIIWGYDKSPWKWILIQITSPKIASSQLILEAWGAPGRIIPTIARFLTISVCFVFVFVFVFVIMIPTTARYHASLSVLPLFHNLTSILISSCLILFQISSSSFLPTLVLFLFIFHTFCHFWSISAAEQKIFLWVMSICAITHVNHFILVEQEAYFPVFRLYLYVCLYLYLNLYLFNHSC